MKKTIFAAILAMSCWSALATQTVQVIWPFAIGSTQAAMTRHLLESANQQQQKYQFVLAHKPGAGGTIAANLTKSAENLTILSSTSSFYSRPMMYYESHNPAHFQMIASICLDTPIAMVSRKYSSSDELKTRNISVGVIPGSATQLFTQLLARHNPDLNITEVPYKGTVEATTDMLGKHIDASIDFLSTGTLARFTADTNVIGVSGRQNIDSSPSFSSLKIKGVEDLTMGYYMFVPATTKSSVAQELKNIFNNAANDAVRNSCKHEKGVVGLMTNTNLDQLHRRNQDQWQKLTQGIPKQ